MITGIQKQIANMLMHTAVENHLKSKYYKKGISPTVEQVMQDINSSDLNTLLAGGYTEGEIAIVIRDAITKRLSGGKRDEQNRVPL